MVKLLINYNLAILFVLSSCSFSKKEMTNLEIIKNTYEGKNAEENGKNLAKYLAPNISWTEAKGFPYAGTFTNLESISKNVFNRLGSEWIDYKFIPKDYVANEDKVFAYGTYAGIYKKTRKSFTARVAHLWKLKDGKIISFEQFVDSKSVIEAML